MKSKRSIIAGVLALVLAVLWGYWFASSEPENHHVTSANTSTNNALVTGTTGVTGAKESDSGTADARSDGTLVSSNPAKTVTFSNVTLDDAVRGAIAGDPYGLSALRSYLDGALGERYALERLAGRVMDGLAKSQIRNDYQAMASATRRLSKAVSGALASGYRLPYELATGNGLPRDARGWDFGSTVRGAPRGFVKITPTSREVGGKTVQVFELAAAQPLFGDGLSGVETFAAPIEDGLYRVYLLSAPRPDGQNPTYPFGDGVRSNGRSIRIVDADQTFKGAEVRFTTNEIATFAPPSALKQGGFAPRQINYGPDGNEAGLALATRALVQDGTLTLAFDIPKGAETYIVGMIVVKTDVSDFENGLDQQIASLLAATEPASGPDNGQSNTSTPFAVAFLPSGSSPSAGHGAPGFGGPGGGTPAFGFSGSSSTGGSGSTGGSSGGYFPGNPSGGFGGSSGGALASSGGGSSGGQAEPQDETIVPIPSSSTSGGDTSSTSGGDTSSTSGGDTSSTSGGDTSSTSGGDTSSTSGGDTSSTSGGDTSSTSGGDTSSTSGGDTSSTSGGDTSSTSSGGIGPDVPEQALNANAGDDLFGFVGENFLIDGCSSMFNDQRLCDMVEDSLTDFSISWKLNDILLAADTLEPIFATGNGTLFNSAGNYIITLDIVYNSELNPLRSSDQMTLNLLSPQLVSAPANLLLVILAIGALGIVRWRKFWA